MLGLRLAQGRGILLGSQFLLLLFCGTFVFAGSGFGGDARRFLRR